jgi:hypothetical protein
MFILVWSHVPEPEQCIKGFSHVFLFTFTLFDKSILILKFFGF